MIVEFANEREMELYAQPSQKCAPHFKMDTLLIDRYKLRIGQLIDAPNIEALDTLQSLKFKKLNGRHKGQFSIVVDDNKRLRFRQLYERKVLVLGLE